MPGPRYDWPIESSPGATQAFREGIANPMYLAAPPALTKLAKVPIPPEPTLAGPAVNLAAPASQAPTRRSPSAPNRVLFGAPRLDPTAGTAKLPLWVPGAGTVRLSGKGIRIRIVPTPPAPNCPSPDGSRKRVA